MSQILWNGCHIRNQRPKLPLGQFDTEKVIRGHLRSSEVILGQWPSLTLKRSWPQLIACAWPVDTHLDPKWPITGHSLPTICDFLSFWSCSVPKMTSQVSDLTWPNVDPGAKSCEKDAKSGSRSFTVLAQAVFQRGQKYLQGCTNPLFRQGLNLFRWLRHNTKTCQFG